MFSGVDWRDLFDLVVVGAHKPDYLVNPYLSMFQVDRYRPPTYLLFIVVCFITCLCIILCDTMVLPFIFIFIVFPVIYPHSAGTLHNLEYKESIDHNALKALQQDRKHIFQGGNWQDLHRMLGVKYGDKILYVANHMFNDILRLVLNFECLGCCLLRNVLNELCIVFLYFFLFASDPSVR